MDASAVSGNNERHRQASYHTEQKVLQQTFYVK